MITIRHISGLLLAGYERHDFTSHMNDECIVCHSTNTRRWKLRKRTFIGWAYQQAIECKNCIWEGHLDPKLTRRTSPKRNANLGKFKSLPKEAQTNLLKKAGLL